MGWNMNSHATWWTVCPFCGQHHDAVTGVGTRGGPSDGDATMCIECGQMCVFDRSVDGGLRRPTDKEQGDLERNGTVKALVDAWRETRRLQ